MMLFALLMVFLASPPNIVLKVVEVEVWAAVPQLPLAPWFLQLWKCHMPCSVSQPGARAIISLALISVILATVVTELHLFRWPSYLRPARYHQTGCLRMVVTSLWINIALLLAR